MHVLIRWSNKDMWHRMGLRSYQEGNQTRQALLVAYVTLGAWSYSISGPIICFGKPLPYLQCSCP